MSNKTCEKLVFDTSINVVNEEETELGNKKDIRKMMGVVTRCQKLNVRERPDVDSKVVTVVTYLDDLEVNECEFDNDWYAVCTATGIEGFCMKQFVTIKR